ncbi:hypothetical protein ACHAW6_008396 [Cyclotella cf. meneghiniana]
MASSAFSFHCMICFEEFDPATNYPVVLPCGHTYVCVECANRLDKCMECRMPLITKIEIPASNSPLSPSMDAAKENRYSSTRSSPAVGRRPTYQQQQAQMQQYSRGKYSQQQQPLPPKQFVTQRLPLPKNAVLLSLIQASEPARRRQAEEPQQSNLPPVLPSSPSEDDASKNNGSNGKSGALSLYNSKEVMPKYSKPSPLFLDTTASSSYDNTTEQNNTSSLGIMIDNHNDEEQKIRVGTYLEGGPCGTYAVAVKTGLLVYPTLFEHNIRNSADEEDGVTRDVEELVKTSYRNKYFSKRGFAEKKSLKGCGLPRSTSCASSTSVATSIARKEKTAEITLEQYDADEHTLEENMAVEAQFNPKSVYVNGRDSDDDEARTPGETTLERNSALSDPGGSKPTHLLPVAALLPKSPIDSSQSHSTAKGEIHRTKPHSPPRATIDASLFASGTPIINNADPALSATLKLRRQFSLGSENPLPASLDSDFDRPLIRLKYGDRVQVVSMDSRGWVKLARGYGYIRLENDKQLVKVGGTSDKACQIEAVLHELSIERNRLKNEQKKLEHLSAGLMIDLQSSLLTSDDMVIVQAPEGMPRSESELNLMLPNRMDRQSSNVSQDDLDISCRSRTSLTNSSSRGLTIGQSTNVNNETQPREIRTVKSHSPGRNYTTPPSPPYNQTTPGGSAVTSYAMTPTRVNFRTGLSGHRALSSSHSHPHDFIDRGGPSRSMSNHAGLGSKKSSNLRGRSIY